MMQPRCLAPPHRQTATSRPKFGGASINAASRTLLPFTCRATEGDQGGKEEVDFEVLFNKELKRRGLEGASSDEVDKKAESRKYPFSDAARAAGQQAGAKGSTRAPPPMANFGTELDGQRARSIGMVNEGLGGLIPRVSQLFQLGGSVFLGFLPFMLAFSLLFTGVYAVFGDSFLHGGREGSGPPPYVEPEYLLSQPTVDPYSPYR